MQLAKEYIEVQEGVRSGKAVFKDTRITVADVLGMLGSGMTEAEIIEEYPKLTHAHILAGLQYAAQREQTSIFNIA